MTDQVLERFWDKVKVDEVTGCWNWTGAKTSGYGSFALKSYTTVKAHRFAYEANKGKIPDGLQLDHLCRNTLCVNPDHLEAVTQRTNVLRGVSMVAKNSQKTHCPKGHEYNEENTYVDPDGHRECKICRIDWYDKYKNSQKYKDYQKQYNEKRRIK